MRLLFICSNNYKSNSGGGGSQCTNRNYLSLCHTFGDEMVDAIQLITPVERNITSVLSRFRNYTRGYNAGISKEVLNTILERSSEFEYVFIDSSYYGVLAKYLKKNKYEGKIICFFHNVEHKMSQEEIKANPLSFWRSLIVYYNEKNAVEFSDKIIVLNKRDLNDLSKIYSNFSNKKTYQIPISFKDNYTSGEVDVEEETNLPPVFLFVGSTWFPNIHGISWFIREVLDHVDIKLQIAGGASNIVSKKLNHPKIEYLGFVPDLSKTIRNADFVLAPIFMGGGMKVKICEALMYGKNIVGTKEAFIGYNVETNKAGAECNTKAEFIETINELTIRGKRKFNTYNRNIFLENYSFASTLDKFKSVFEEAEV